MRRRDLLKLAGAWPVAACAAPRAASARVVVVGGGYGGATAARYLRLWQPALEVVLVEREARFASCPLSNLVLGGSSSMSDISRDYDGLRRRGVEIVHDEASGLDLGRRRLRLRRGSDLGYDRLILSPGVEFLFAEIDGYRASSERVLHAWKAGAQTLALRRQLEAMPEGGVYVLSIPPVPFRCPPGPYERACQVAHYFKRAKPRAKVLVLDANPDVMSKRQLFKRAWRERYSGLIEYRANARVIAVDEKRMTVETEFDTLRGDVLNIIPPQRAGEIAASAGLITHNDKWCDVDWRSCESKAAARVHLLGDATLAASGMPKSGHMANQQAKVCAAAILALLEGREPAPPVMNNTCYSFVSDTEAMHIASVHQWDAAARTILPVEHAGGLSAAPSALEGRYAWDWARSIWDDMLA